MIQPIASLMLDLYHLMDRLSAAGGLEAVLDEVLSAAMVLTDADMGNLGLYDAKSETLTILSYKGFPDDYVQHMSTLTKPVKSGPSEQAFASRRRVVVDDVHADPAFRPHEFWVRRAGFLTMQATPILNRHGLPIGTICTYNRNRQGRSEERLHFLDLYAKLAADAIEREQTGQQLRESEERFRQLHGLTLRLTDIDSLEGALDEVLQAAIDLVKADAGLVRLFEAPDGAYPFVAHHGLDDGFIKYFTSLPEALDMEAPSRLAAKRGEPVLIEDVRVDPRYQPHLEVLEAAGVRSSVAMPLINRRGGPLGAICTFFPGPEVPDTGLLQTLELYARMASDTIERLDREAEQAKYEQSLRRAIAAKDNFLGLVSHELRTPMTMIRGLASVLRRNRGIEEATLLDVYDDLGEASERLYRLIENMLVLAKLELGQTPPSELLLVDRMVETCANTLRSEMPDLDLVVEPLPAETMVLGIQQYIGQIMRNLVENAWKYSPRGSPVQVRVSTDEEDVQIAVLDRGIGLKNPETLFQPFHREADAEGLAPGLGLGLAVCKTLAEAQGGRIWAETRDGGGSTFCFTLRRAVEADTCP